MSATDQKATGVATGFSKDAPTTRKSSGRHTVFNCLIEVNRSVDRFVRATHSKSAVEYQRRGIATAVHEWALGQGFCLHSGALQSQRPCT